MLRAVDAVATSATTWHQSGREPADLYRGGRLDQATALAIAAPDRLRSIDTEFIEASRSAAEAEQGKERQRIRRLRRLVAGTAVALAVALIAGGLAFRSQRRADDEAANAIAQREAAEQQRAAAVAAAEEATAATERAELATLISRSAATAANEPEVALLLALEAHRRTPGPDTEQAVFNALGSSSIPNRVASVPWTLAPGETCLPDPPAEDTLDYGVLDGQLVTRDNLTGVITTHGPSPTPCGTWHRDEALDRRWVLDGDRQRLFLGPFAGPHDVEIAFDQPLGLGPGPFLRSGRLYVAGRRTMTVIDDRTGKTLGDPIGIADGEIASFAFSDDLSQLAVSFRVDTSSGNSGVTIFIDPTRSEEIARIATPVPLGILRFDDAVDEIVAVGWDGVMVTFDLETGELLHTVDLSSLDIRGLDVRADGLLLAASFGQVQLVDRRTGPIGAPVELSNYVGIALRSDGLVQVLTPDAQLEVLDLNGNALIEQAHEVGSFTNSSIRNGRAGLIDLANREAQIIDLATGDRTPVELRTSDGGQFAASVIIPTSDGVWAAARNDGIGRWLDGELVEKIDLSGVGIRGWLHLDRFAVLAEQSDGSHVAHLVNLEPGNLDVVVTISGTDAIAAHPTADDGIYLVEEPGLLREFGADGTLIETIEIEGIGSDLGAGNVTMTIDPATGRLAIGGTNGIVLVDPATGDVETLPAGTQSSSLGFAGNGELLAITGHDGTVRLWDVERGVSAGLAWRGSGARSNSFSPQNDPSADSMWVIASGKLLQIPLTPELWIERACEVVGRDLTEDEWERLVPGDGPVQSACG